MRRTVGYVFGVLVLALLVCVPAVIWGWGGADAGDEPTSISRYRADFVVGADGDLTARERIAVDFPFGDRHGIFRFFDISDPGAPHVRRVPEDIRVSRDGAHEPFEVLTESRGRYRVVKIGSADRTVPAGTHTYEIRYRIPGVLEPGTDGTTSQLYWNLVPGGWRQPIAEARLTVRLPADAQRVRCAVGTGSTGGCDVRADGARVVVRASDLAPFTPVTLKAGVDVPTPPPGVERPWSQRWDAVLGPAWAWPVIALLGLLAAIAGFRTARSTDEEDPAFPLQYAPPEGLGPAQAAYLLTERTDRKAFVGTLMYAAEKGAVTVDRHPDGAWEIRDRGGARGWAGLDDLTRRIAGLLAGEGGTFVAARKDVAAGERLKDELTGFESDTRQWARREGLLEKAGLGHGAGLLVVVAAVATVALAVVSPVDLSLAAVVPGLFAVFAAPTLRPGSATRRTPKGRDLWSRVGGFRRILATPSSVARFDFSGRRELYTAYLPWAVAFGCAEQWAAKYRTEMGAEPPGPVNFAGGYVGVPTGAYVDQMVDDFDSAVSSSISAYQATQSSSGGGGGGFSGGGGGGGGGGGSW